MVEQAPLFKIKSTLLPSLNIDYSLLGYKSPAKKDLFTYELELQTRYQERIREIEELSSLQRRKSQSNDRAFRQSVGQEFQQTLLAGNKKIEERNQKVQSSGERDRKINELMQLCPGIKDHNEAIFYLEAQQFNVENAKNFYTSCTGKSNIARNNSFTIKFLLPGKVEFSEVFEGNKLMWSMLATIHNHLQKKTNFKVKLKSVGREITFEEMTKKTFDNYGITSNTVLVIEYA